MRWKTEGFWKWTVEDSPSFMKIIGELIRGWKKLHNEENDGPTSSTLYCSGGTWFECVALMGKWEMCTNY